MNQNSPNQWITLAKCKSVESLLVQPEISENKKILGFICMSMCVIELKLLKWV